MGDGMVYNWDAVEMEVGAESISAEEQAASDDISISTPVGRFLCTIVSSEPVEKTFKEYNCFAAHLKMRIDKVLGLELPMVKDGKPVLDKDGKQVSNIQDITNGDKRASKYLGYHLFDDINLFHAKEKEAMKKRRLFVLKKTGTIAGSATQVTPSMFAKDILNRQVIVTTEHNVYTDKNTNTQKDNPRVAWAGYEYAEMAGGDANADYLNI